MSSPNIVLHINILIGKPCIKNNSISVASILEWIAANALKNETIIGNSILALNK